MEHLDPAKFKEARGSRTFSEIALGVSKILDRLVTRQMIANWEKGGKLPSHRMFDAYRVVVGKSASFFYTRVEDSGNGRKRKAA